MMPPGILPDWRPTRQRIWMALSLGLGENAARSRRQHRLAESKVKDCDRQPNQSGMSPEHERGKARRNVK